MVLPSASCKRTALSLVGSCGFVRTSTCESSDPMSQYRLSIALRRALWILWQTTRGPMVSEYPHGLLGTLGNDWVESEIGHVWYTLH